jgi:septum formation inhibitor MinC
MNDDWRLRVDVHEEGTARELTQRLEAFDLAHELRTEFADRVIVSRDGQEVFCYSATREQVEAARKAIVELAGQHGWDVQFALHRWHPAAERWEDPEEPLPSTGQEVAAEHAEVTAQEREESAEQGYPDYEVRVKCASRADAAALAERLRTEGFRIVHRGEFIVLGATDEESARQIAERIRGEAPPGSEVVAEGSVPEVISEAPFATPFNPFAVFGGLSGG